MEAAWFCHDGGALAKTQRNEIVFTLGQSAGAKAALRAFHVNPKVLQGRRVDFQHLYPHKNRLQPCQGTRVPLQFSLSKTTSPLCSNSVFDRQEQKKRKGQKKAQDPVPEAQAGGPF